MATLIQDRYKILELLGEGGMGNVYLAEDQVLPRRVAIKEVRHEFLENDEVLKRIEREAKLHSKIGSHENIVTMFDLIKDNDKRYMVLEYVQGETLDVVIEKQLDQGMRLSEGAAIHIVLQILKALQRIHASGVIHRDLKPGNLLVSRDDESHWLVKLMDFGIARVEDESQDKMTKLTRKGGGPGTPSYMAPEQIDSKTFGEISICTDIYAVGIIFYELMTGLPPFQGTLTEVYTGHLMKDVKEQAETKKMTALWKELICTALEKKQEDRFPSAKAFYKAIVQTRKKSVSEREQDTKRTRILADINTAKKTRIVNSATSGNKQPEDDALKELLKKSRKSNEANKTQVVQSKDAMAELLLGGAQRTETSATKNVPNEKGKALGVKRLPLPAFSGRFAHNWAKPAVATVLGIISIVGWFSFSDNSRQLASSQPKSALQTNNVSVANQIDISQEASNTSVSTPGIASESFRQQRAKLTETTETETALSRRTKKPKQRKSPTRTNQTKSTPSQPTSKWGGSRRSIKID